jgi:hypothetical protein|tara:strand:- start:1765 stop:2586 length:822 start_codon:yes stop_codon:yes gene_type:complete
MKFRHNKKRNPAFVFEALTREFAKARLYKDEEGLKKIKKIMQEVFNKDGLLYKQLRLYKALTETRNVDYLTAEKIVAEVHRVFSTFEQKALYDEQTTAIHKINYELAPSVFNNYISNYKSLASAYQMFNDNTIGVKDRVLLEKKIIQKMITPLTEEKVEEPVDEIVVKMFMKKFNNTFGNLMTEQKTLISKYMGSLKDDDTELKIFVNEELERLKEEIKENMGIEEFQADDLMKKKVAEVYKLLEDFRSKRTLQKQDLVFILKTQQLVEEIKG